MARQSHMERKIPRDRKHPQSSKQGQSKKAPSRQHHQGQRQRHQHGPHQRPTCIQQKMHGRCQLIQELMTWITVLPLRGSHSFEVKQLFPDGSLGKALFKGSPQQWLGSHTWKGRSPETESILSHPIKGQSKKAPSRQHHQR